MINITPQASEPLVKKWWSNRTKHKISLGNFHIMATIGCWCQLIQMFSVTKCPSIQPLLLHFFCIGMRTFVRFLTQVQVYFVQRISLIGQPTSLVREGNEVCLVSVEPTLCARIVAFFSGFLQPFFEQFAKSVFQDQH